MIPKDTEMCASSSRKNRIKISKSDIKVNVNIKITFLVI